MYGVELQMAREKLRRELRRELRERMGPDKALDVDDLLARVSDPYPTPYGGRLRERFVLKGLQELGISDERVAAAFGFCTKELARRRDTAWRIDGKYNREIEDRIAREIFETPEPDRYVAALDGQGGPVNPIPSGGGWPQGASPREADREEELSSRQM